MKKIVVFLIVSGFSALAYSEPLTQPFSPPMVLDEVTFQLTAKQWVSTQTALLTVNVNVTLNDADLVKAREAIMGKLNQIVKGEWHLTQFDRSQDSSGLEKLYVQAQVRVSQSSLTHIYQQAKAVSKPGESYEIGAVEFKPSLEEVQKVKASLRDELYKQAADELVRLNQLYAGQHYSVNQLLFFDADAVPQTKQFRSNEMIATMALPASAPSMTVSNELVMSALVKAASTRQPVN